MRERKKEDLVYILEIQILSVKTYKRRTIETIEYEMNIH